MVLLIYGAGAAAEEIYDLVYRNDMMNGRYSAVYYLVDDEYYIQPELAGVKIVKYSSYKNEIIEEKEVVIAMGEPKERYNMYCKAKKDGLSFATLIDCTATISKTATIAQGCIVYAGAVVSSEAEIQENCMLMFHSIIGHHAVIRRNSVVCPKANVGGFSRVGEEAFIGLGSSMLQHVNVGSHAIVGLGSMVFRDVPDNTVVIGNPARVTRGNVEHKVF